MEITEAVVVGRLAKDHGKVAPPDLLRQFGHQPLPIGLGRLTGLAVAVFVAGRDVFDLDEQRLKLGAAPGIAPDGQGAQGVAVVALPTGDEVPPLRLADLDKVLAGHFQGRFHRFAATADKVGVAHASRGVGHQVIGQGFGHLGGEKTGVGIGQAVDLLVHGLQHVRVPMAQTGHRGAA